MHRLVPGPPPVRVDPDQPVRQRVEAAHLLTELLGLLPLPSVARDDDHRAARRAAPAPGLQEGGQPLTQARTTRPVRDGGARGDQGAIGVTQR